MAPSDEEPKPKRQRPPRDPYKPHQPGKDPVGPGPGPLPRPVPGTRPVRPKRASKAARRVLRQMRLYPERMHAVRRQWRRSRASEAEWLPEEIR